MTYAKPSPAGKGDRNAVDEESPKHKVKSYRNINSHRFGKLKIIQAGEQCSPLQVSLPLYKRYPKRFGGAWGTFP